MNETTAKRVLNSQARAKGHPCFVRMTKRRRVWLNKQNARTMGVRPGWVYCNLALFRRDNNRGSYWDAVAVVKDGEMIGSSCGFNLKKK